EGAFHLRKETGHRRAHGELRLFRRRHAFVFVGRSTHASHRRNEKTHFVGRRGGGHVRVRTGNAHRSQIESDSRHGRDAAFARHRKFFRSHPGNQRTRASFQGSFPCLQLRARNRFS